MTACCRGWPAPSGASNPRSATSASPPCAIARDHGEPWSAPEREARISSGKVLRHGPVPMAPADDAGTGYTRMGNAAVIPLAGLLLRKTGPLGAGIGRHEPRPVQRRRHPGRDAAGHRQHPDCLR